MNCTKCGCAVPENGNVRFCPGCGSPLLPQIQIPQANAGGGVPQQARTARGYSGAPARTAAPSPQGGAQSDATMFGGSPSGGGYNPQGAGYAPQGGSAPGDATMFGGRPSGGGYNPQGAGYVPQGGSAPGDATMFGSAPSGSGYNPGGSGYTPSGAGFPPNAGGADDTVFLGGNGENKPQTGEPAGKGSGGGNKKFLAIVIPLIAVIIAALAVIFIFVVYPEIKGDPEDTSTEPATASQETESDTEAPTTEATSEAATASQAPSETAQDTTAEPESVTTVVPVSSSGYNTGHYVNSTESRVHIRNTTSKSGKHVDYVQPDEYIDVFEVLDLGASTDATVRWWGKVTKGGKTGWVSLYYLTCVDLIGTPLNSGQINQLWQTLQGYWNTLDKKRYSSFSMDNGSPYFMYSPWSGSAVISAHVDAEGMGDLNGLVRLHLHEDAADASGEVNAELYLDLSEMKNGRIAWSFGTGWEDGYFAGTDQSKAKPKR